MNVRKTGFLLLLTVLFSCTQKVSESTFQTISLKESKDVLPISSFANKLEYIELKASESGIELGEIEAIKNIDNDLIVKQRMSGKRSFIRFDQSGAFICKLTSESIFTNNEPKDVIKYENGYAVLAEEGIYSINKLGNNATELVGGLMPGNRFFFSGGEFRVLNEMNRGELLQSFLAGTRNNTDAEMLQLSVQRMTYSALGHSGKNEIHFYTALSDTIFACKNNRTVPVVGFEGNKMPTFAQLCDSIVGMGDTDALRFLREKEHVVIRKYLENKNYLYLTYWVGSNSTTAILNKKTGTTRYFSHGMNDLDGGVWDKPLYLSEKDELYVPISAYKVSGHKISNKKQKSFSKLQKQLAGSNNPVLMKVRLR